MKPQEVYTHNKRCASRTIHTRCVRMNGQAQRSSESQLGVLNVGAGIYYRIKSNYNHVSLHLRYPITRGSESEVYRRYGHSENKPRPLGKHLSQKNSAVSRFPRAVWTNVHVPKRIWMMKKHGEPQQSTHSTIRQICPP